jgi:Lectin C-type domain
MEPLVLESGIEQQCLSNFTSVNWKFNYNYWTGGTQQGCMGQWRWCGSADKIVKTELLWAPKQPDNKYGKEACMQMRIYNKAPTFGIKLSDRPCSDKYLFACQVRNRLHQTVLFPPNLLIT